MRAMIVDDNDDIRLLLRQVLTLGGIEVVEASGAPDALALLDDGVTADVVMLDVQMPLMDGWEALREIRRRSPRMPVVLCTVKSSSADAQRGWTLGADGYITKPFDVGRIVEELHSVVDRSVDQRAEARAAAIDALRRDRSG